MLMFEIPKFEISGTYEVFQATITSLITHSNIPDDVLRRLRNKYLN